MKNKPVLLFLATVVVLLTPTLEGRNWKRWFAAQNQTEEFIDLDSIVRLKGNHVRAWVMHLNSEFKGNLSLIEVNCAERTYTMHRFELGTYDVSTKEWETDYSTWSIPVTEAVAKEWGFFDPSSSKPDWEYIGNSDWDEAQYKVFCIDTRKHNKK